MVTDEERDSLCQASTADPRMPIDPGVRRRLAPLLETAGQRSSPDGSSLLALRHAVLYYGDEIGMGDNVCLGDRNGVRTPMQWTGDRTPASRMRTSPACMRRSSWIRYTDTRQSSWKLRSDRRLAVYLDGAHDRAAAAAPRVRRGSLEFLRPANRKILAFTRSHEGEPSWSSANLARAVQPAELDLSALTADQVEMMGATEFPRIGDIPYFLALGPYSFYWFVLRM